MELKTTPVRETFLPFHKPWIGEEEKREVLDTLESGWLTKGPKTILFEQQFADYLSVPHAVGTNSCTSALHLALVAMGIGSGDEVITTPITFAATVNVIEHCGATPVFVDVESETLNLNPDLLEAAVTGRTKAIIPVHFAGQMCRMDLMVDFARKHGLHVIEDAAHALEATYEGKPPGHWGELAAFSFYATKNITTGEGGMLTTRDESMAERLEILSLHGLSRDAWKRYSLEGYRHWEILEPGFKYHMTDLQASLGIHQLQKVERFWKARKDLVDFYDEELSRIKGIEPLKDLGHGRHAYHLYVIRIKKDELGISRDDVLERLQREGIGVGIHFRAVHRHPYYQNRYRIPEGALPVAEKASEEVVSLPLYPLMSLEDARDVVQAIKKVWS